jgi:hypothetical protein
MPSNQNNIVGFASNHPPAQQNQQQTNFTTETNPSSIGTQTENSFSKNSLEQKISSLGKEIKSLRKQNQLNGGIIRLGVIGLVVYAIATNWSAITSAFTTAATATAAASPVIGIVIGAIIGAAVLVGAFYAAWRYRAEIKAGFKYAAEKTVEGAKDLYERAKKVVNSVTYYDHDHQNAFLKKMAEFNPENNKNYEEIRKQLKVISNEKDGDVLLKNILSEIGSTIDSKIADKEKLANTDLPKAADKPASIDQSKAADKSVSEANKPANANQSEADKLLLSEWKMQREFIKRLNSKSLKGLVNDKTGFPKDHYLITKIFSEHHSEIKEVIARSKQDHILESSREVRSNMFYGDAKPKKPFSLPSFPSLRRKDPKQPDNSPSHVTNSNNSSGFSTPDSRFITPNSSGFSTPIDDKELTKKLEELRKPSSTSRSGSPDSGRGSSGSSTSGKRKLDASPDDLSEAHRKLGKTGSSNKPLEQPSTRVFGQKPPTPVNLPYRETTV